jgi:hypothetical protein
VQYGLGSLVSGEITMAEFLKLNFVLGGWKEPGDMAQEGFPFVGPFNPANFDPWSARNQVYSTGGAQRRAPRVTSKRCAPCTGPASCSWATSISRSSTGGRISSRRSTCTTRTSPFAARKRMLNAKGEADNMVIWFTDSLNGAAVFDQTPEALEVLDEWLTNLRHNPAMPGVAANKPSRATDRCFTAFGEEIAAGDDVWNGIIDEEAPGACTQQFKIYSTTRRVAGGPFEQSLFKCQRIPVTEAVARGFYGDACSDRSRSARCTRSSRRACATTASRTPACRRSGRTPRCRRGFSPGLRHGPSRRRAVTAPRARRNLSSPGGP